MVCEYCGAKSPKVIDSRTIQSNEIVRKRKCKECGKVFWTCESFVDYDEIKKDYLEVLKKLRLGEDC